MAKRKSEELKEVQEPASNGQAADMPKVIMTIFEDGRIVLAQGVTSGDLRRVAQMLMNTADKAPITGQAVND